MTTSRTKVSVKVLSIDRVRFGRFEFDRRNRLLSRDGAELALPPRAVGLLACLIDRAGEIVSKPDLLDEVWKDAIVAESSLTEAVSLLRQVLGDDPQRPAVIQTVPRRGYRFVAPLEEVREGETPPHRRLGGLPHASVGPSPTGALPEAAPAADAARLGRAPGPLATGPLAPGPLATGAPAIGPSATSPFTIGPSATGSPADVWPAWLPWVFAAVTLALLLVFMYAVMRQPAMYTRPVVRFTVDLPAGLRLAPSAPGLAISRDGRRVAFVAERASVGSDARPAPPLLYVRDLDRLEPLALDGTEGAAAPFFSPDGRWIAFFAGGALKKVSASGGPVVRLCAAGAAFGGSWGTRRTIVFAASVAGGLSRVHEDGGDPVVISTPDPDAGEVRHAWPEWLPDERGILFAGIPLAGAPEAARIAALSLESGRIQPLTDAATSPHYLPSGHLLFARAGTILAAPFDPGTLELLGAAVPVLDDVAADDGSGAARFALAPSGHAAIVRAAPSRMTASYRWLGPEASAFPLPFPARQLRGLTLAPDGRRVAAALGDGHRTDIWVSDLTHGGPRRLTSDGQNVEPRWAPDGRRLLFASRANGPFALFSKDVDAEAISPVRMIARAPDAPPSPSTLASPRHQLPASVSANGIVFVDVQPKTGLDLWFLPFTGGPARLLVRTPADEAAGVLSPDGRWLAWQVNEEDGWMLMVRRDDEGTPVRVARTDGTPPAWSPDGRRLYFSEDGRLSEVPMPAAASDNGGAPPSVGPPRTIATDLDPDGGFSVASDGRLLVRARDAAASPATQFQIVLDWSRELSVKVPVTPRTPRNVR